MCCVLRSCENYLMLLTKAPPKALRNSPSPKLRECLQYTFDLSLDSICVHILYAFIHVDLNIAIIKNTNYYINYNFKILYLIVSMSTCDRYVYL